METLSCFGIKTYYSHKSTQATMDGNLPTFFTASLFYFSLPFFFYIRAYPLLEKQTEKSINKHIIVNKGLPNGYILLFFSLLVSAFFFRMNMYTAWFNIKLALISYSLLLFFFFRNVP